MRSHIIIAAVLFSLEILLGIGLFGGIGLLVAVVLVVLAFVEGRSPLRHHLQAASVYLCLFVGTMLLLNVNWRLAEHRAAPIIIACKDYRAATGKYPSRLDDLVPRFLPSVPNAKYTLIANKFGYDADRPSLYFAAMFHGVVFYDFQTDNWRTND